MTVALRDENEARVTLVPSQRPETYELYGLAIRSEVPLPCPVRLADHDAEVAWEIRLATDNAIDVSADATLVSQRSCDLPCHDGAVYSRIRRGPTGSWFWWERAGTFFVPASNDRVEVTPEPDHSLRAIGLMLIGQVAGLMMARRGITSLHASAVVVDGKAVAFIAPPGSGKSTLAAGFVARGASLLTDDVLPLARAGDDIVGLPSLPMMKVWHDTAHHTLDLDVVPEMKGGVAVEKSLVTDRAQLRFAEDPAPLRAIYVVDRFDPAARGTTEVTTERLGARAAIAALLGQTYRADILTAAEMATSLPLYARLAACAPVRRLSYPSGYGLQAATHAQILADLDAS